MERWLKLNKNIYYIKDLSKEKKNIWDLERGI